MFALVLHRWYLRIPYYSDFKIAVLESGRWAIFSCEQYISRNIYHLDSHCQTAAVGGSRGRDTAAFQGSTSLPAEPDCPRCIKAT